MLEKQGDLTLIFTEKNARAKILFPPFEFYAIAP